MLAGAMQALAVLLFFLLLAFPAHLWAADAASDPNRRSGIVTEIRSPTEVMLDGEPIELTPATVYGHRVGQVTARLHERPTLYVGEVLEVTGEPRHKKPFLVEELRTTAMEPVSVSGSGLIDRVFQELPPVSGHGGPTQLVLADGYLLRIPGGVLAADVPSPLRPNLLLAYKGMLQADGSVEVRSADAVVPVVSQADAKAREKSVFDDAVIQQAANSTPQSRFSRVNHGLDLKRIPVIDEAALQAQVDRIGRSLIPAAQRNLPKDDPSAVAYAFHVVDAPSACILRPLSSARVESLDGVAGGGLAGR